MNEANNHNQNNEEQKCFLPPQSLDKLNMKTLVLDLDETLVHSQFEESELASYCLEIEYQNTVKIIYVIERPGVQEFLKTLAQYFELVLFTSGQQPYAEKVLEKLDPNKEYFSHGLYRQHCINQDLWYAKDLRMIGRDLKDVIIVDNSYECFAMQPENGFLISSFFDDMEDDELMENLEFFIQLSELQDVREVEYWKEQFDNMLKNEEDQIESLNEIKEDSNEQIASPLCSQLSHLIVNGDEINESRSRSSSSKNSNNNEERKKIDEYKKKQSHNIGVSKKFSEEIDNYNKEKQGMDQKIYRRQKGSKTMILQNNQKKQSKQKSQEAPPQTFGNHQLGTMNKLTLCANNNAMKTYSNIEEAGFQRIKNRTNSQLNVKIDEKRFDKDYLMSPLRKNQEYYSKHSKLFFI